MFSIISHKSSANKFQTSHHHLLSSTLLPCFHHLVALDVYCCDEFCLSEFRSNPVLTLIYFFESFVNLVHFFHISVHMHPHVPLIYPHNYFEWITLSPNWKWEYFEQQRNSHVWSNVRVSRIIIFWCIIFFAWIQLKWTFLICFVNFEWILQNVNFIIMFWRKHVSAFWLNNGECLILIHSTFSKQFPHSD